MPLLRRHRSNTLGTPPVAGVTPDPLRSPEDAYETGLLIGLLGRTPWFGIVVKNMKDRRIATGRDVDAVHAAGQAAGRRAGKPPESPR